jgi:hypothetical protein
MSTRGTTDRIDTLLLLALPASGKSVIRRYLSSLSSEVVEADFHLGPLVQLDDFPYVHFMLHISEVMEGFGYESGFFNFEKGWMRDLRDWGTLVHLLNEDYAALNAPRLSPVRSPGEWIVERLEKARALTGAPDPFSQLDEGARRMVAAAVEGEAEEFAAEWSARRRPPGATVVIEFARGGPEGSNLPMEPPFGYAWSLSQFSAEILGCSVILYVWVTPEESRRRNRKRMRPGEDGSILHHGVPEAAMHRDYGTDDMKWLIDHSELPGTITVRAHESTFHVPVACYDNRRDLTVFQRDDPSSWPSGEAEEVHRALRGAFTRLVPRTR